jgi:Endonuclease NucS
MNTDISEKALRDMLALDVTVLEPGLVLHDKEKFMPNDLGTRSFIDLYATDPDGHHVLIELKRSDASAREAIHEVHKYVEGVKAYLGARESEIRVIIVSTTWRELLVPFSRLLVDTSLALRGLEIQLRSGILQCTEVVPLKFSCGRFIAPWADLRWFESEEDLNGAIDLIGECYRKREIVDYVILVMEVGDGLIESQREISNARLASLLCDAGEKSEAKIEIPDYKFAAYVAMQLLSEEKYEHLLRRDKENWDNIRDCFEDLEGEERLCSLHENLLNINIYPNGGCLEVGYPAKISMYLDSGGLVSKKLLRFGSFKRNNLLADDTIISELKGESGSSGQRLKRTISADNRSHIVSAKEDIHSCLKNNPIWSQHILRCLSDIEQDFPHAKIDLSLFNPSTGVLTIYFAATREDGVLYVPMYSLVVLDPHPVRIYFGALAKLGDAASFDVVLKEFYDGCVSGLLLTMAWGGYEDRDLEILERLGAGYGSFRCDLGSEERRFHQLSDDRWRRCEEINPIFAFSEYLNLNAELVEEIIARIGTHDHGGLVIF